MKIIPIAASFLACALILSLPSSSPSAVFLKVIICLFVAGIFFVSGEMKSKGNGYSWGDIICGVVWMAISFVQLLVFSRIM